MTAYSPGTGEALSHAGDRIAFCMADEGVRYALASRGLPVTLSRTLSSCLAS